MKIAIIGAGASGLVSLKYALDDGHTCDVFEQSGEIGGVWVYTDLTVLDEYGLPLHSPMYQGLTTNLPKETMTFQNFPYENVEKSYISQAEVLKYLRAFAERNQLEKHIQFRKYVVKVEPLENSRWTVTVLDATTSVEKSDTYDAIFVCNGHYRDLIVPLIAGQNVFEGLQMHSHKYRSPELFENKTVLIIGAASSGQDICAKISGVAKHIFITKMERRIVEKPENATEKCRNVTQLKARSAVFEDGSEEDIDAVIYCTGYNYSFPFLSKECGITVKAGKYIYPLYKHVVNAEKPTMVFVGIPFLTFIFPMLDLQARFALSLLKNANLVPTKEEMLVDINEKNNAKIERGWSERYFHRLGGSTNVGNYFRDLSETGHIQNLPSVLVKIYDDVNNSDRHPDTIYKIIDDDTFTVSRHA